MDTPVAAAVRTAQRLLCAAVPGFDGLPPVRFRPDGQGGELASPLPMMVKCEAQELCSRIASDLMFERVCPSGSWIAFDLSEQWRTTVRDYAERGPNDRFAVPPMPDFPARIPPMYWRLDTFLGYDDPALAARLDSSNPGFQVMRADILSGRREGQNAPDRMLVNLCAAALEPDSAESLLAAVRRYLAAPAEDALMHSMITRTKLKFTDYSPPAEQDLLQ